MLADSSFVLDQTRIGTMAKWRQAVELALSDEDIAKLTAISRSRTERGSRVDRARMLLAPRGQPFEAAEVAAGDSDVVIPYIDVIRTLPRRSEGATLALLLRWGGLVALLVR